MIILMYFATELLGSGTDFDVVSIKDTPSYATLVEKRRIGILWMITLMLQVLILQKYNGVTDQVTVDGSLYELPFRSDVWFVFYNKDIFDAAGIDYPTNNMTVEEYDKLARSLADDTLVQKSMAAIIIHGVPQFSYLESLMENTVYLIRIMIL